jgi:hypothetical protein
MTVLLSHVGNLAILEIEQGEFLGRGEFGDVWEVKAVHVDCIRNMGEPDEGKQPFQNEPHSYLSDRTRYLKTRSLRSRLASDIGDAPTPSNDSSRFLRGAAVASSL